MSRAAAAAGSGARRGLVVAFALPERAAQLLREARWILFIALALFLALILFTYDRNDPGWSHAVSSHSIQNAGGRVGAWFADLLLYLFGLSAYLFVGLAVSSVWRGYRQLRPRLPAEPVPAGKARRRSRAAIEAEAASPAHGRFPWEVWLGFVAVLFGSAALEASRLHSLDVSLPLAPGGLFGLLISDPLFAHVGAVGGTLVLFAVVATGLSLWIGVSWLSLMEMIGTGLELAWERASLAVAARKDRRIGEVAMVEREEQVEELRRIIDDDPEPVRIERPTVRIEPSVRATAEMQAPLFVDLPADTQLPALSLLDPPPVSLETVSPETLEYTSRLIEKKLADFNVAAHVVAAYPGPVITRYEIEPATGVKGSQIVNLSKDLARALSLVSLRVVETIPGKNLMGLELPNPRRQAVRLSEILGSQVYADSASAVTLALGKDIAGHPICADLARMPHLLVAGTTGSGKSVGINAMLLSLLYKSDPSQVRMILIDPKMLEMSSYEGIPHLLAPVVTDMKHAGNALNWCVAEMERRYRLLSKLGVRNLSGYNAKIADAEKRETLIPNPFSLTPDAPEPLGRLPQIVVVIDELADLMMVVGKKVEELIARLAQKARAAGIHLILATQRPSVDVITGLIKANIPTRIAFQVSSKIDSRTI
nr:DNA translocase FtsK 4TM domain-containing protein [Burkholderiaceae bacterium]